MCGRLTRIFACVRVNAAEAKRKEEEEEEKQRKEEEVRAAAAAAAAAGDENALNKLGFCGVCCMWLRVSLHVSVCVCFCVLSVPVLFCLRVSLVFYILCFFVCSCVYVFVTFCVRTTRGGSKRRTGAKCGTGGMCV